MTDGPAKQSRDGMSFIDKTGLDAATQDASHPAHSTIDEVLLFLSICHSIVIDKRTGKMNSASPDELALVEGAANQGYEFLESDAQSVISIKRKRDNTLLKYQTLNVLEFNSTRKRMSIIVKDCQTQQIVLLCKGADSIIKERLNRTDAENSRDMDKTQKYVDDFA